MYAILRVILVLTATYPTFGYNILGVFPHVGKSHFHVFQPLMKALAEKGHNVTVISYFPSERPIRNYRDVALKQLGSTVDEVRERFSKNEVKDVKDLGQLLDNLDEFLRLDKHDSDSKLFMYGIAFVLTALAKEFCDQTLRSEILQNFLREGNTFDLMIIEEFNTDCFHSINEKFRAPIVGVSSCTLMPWTGQRYGNPNHPAYVPNNFLPLSDRMGFFDRVENAALNTFQQLFYDWVASGSDKRIAGKYLGESAGNLDKFVYNASLHLTNSHFSLNLPRPLVPGMIEIGGMHIGKAKPLPENIKKFIEESEHGVIYFSFGSLVQSHTMSKEKLQAFQKAFARLPQRVLWKWDNATMEGKPDNVMFQKWMPQFDILSHSNVKAFISHGGLLGTMEAVHNGVPMIVMPQFGDQHTNAKAIEASGGGIILRFSHVTEETLHQALKKVLSTSVQTQAKELSERFNDRPLPPLETAIYWVEYVARHRGAPHLRTAAVGMPWYQYYLLDVISFILLILGTIAYALHVVIRFIIRGLMKKTVKTKTS